MLRTPDLVGYPLDKGGTQEWAEIYFAANALGQTKRGRCRFVAVRELVRQTEMFDTPGQHPFLTLGDTDANGVTGLWKLTAVVTNRMEAPGPDVIQWYRDRCGKSEEAHAVMKNDLAGGRMPSTYFGANAA